MAQNVNLLAEIAITPVTYLNSRFMAKISAVWILLLILIYAAAFSVNMSKKQTLTTLENKKTTLQSKIDTYQRDLLHLQGGETSLSLQSINNTTGFYNYLKDLAAFTPHAVWLTNISISEVDNSITIVGSTVAPSGVSALLEALDKAPSFGNKKFNNISMEKKSDSIGIDFKISSINPNNNTENKTNTITTDNTENKIKEIPFK